LHHTVVHNREDSGEKDFSSQRLRGFRKLNDTQEFCNVTPPLPSLHSVVSHRGRKALIHMPYYSEYCSPRIYTREYLRGN